MKKFKYYLIILAIFLLVSIFLYPAKPTSYLRTCYVENMGYMWCEFDQYTTTDIAEIRSSKGPRTLYANPVIDFFKSYLNHTVLIYPYYYGKILVNISSSDTKLYNQGVSYINYYGYASYRLSEKSEKAGANNTTKIMGNVLGSLTPFIFLTLLIRTIVRMRKNKVTDN